MRWLSTSSRMKAGSNLAHWSNITCRLSAGSYASSSVISLRRAGSMAAVLYPLPAAALSPSAAGVAPGAPPADAAAAAGDPESVGLSGLDGSFEAVAAAGALEEPCIQPDGLKLFAAEQPQQQITPAANAHRMTVHRPMSASLPDESTARRSLEKGRRGWVSMGLAAACVGRRGPRLRAGNLMKNTSWDKTVCDDRPGKIRLLRTLRTTQTSRNARTNAAEIQRRKTRFSHNS